MEDAADDKKALTKLLLSGGMLAGPLYLAVGFIEAFTREGFDISRHALSLLSNGDFGWVHRANLIITGILVFGSAVGMRRMLISGKGRIWGPILIGLYGLGLIASGFFNADPARGFPPGTAEDAIAITTNGMLHFISGGIGFLGLIAACFVFSQRFAQANDIAWKVNSFMTGIIFLAGFIGIASGSSSGWVILGFWIAVIVAWAWFSSLSAKLKRELE